MTVFFVFMTYQPNKAPYHGTRRSAVLLMDDTSFTTTNVKRALHIPSFIQNTHSMNCVKLKYMVIFYTNTLNKYIFKFAINVNVFLLLHFFLRWFNPNRMQQFIWGELFTQMPYKLPGKSMWQQHRSMFWLCFRIHGS